MAGTKHDQEKPRMDLLPFDSITGVATVLTYGAGKYAPRDWESGIAYGRLLAATLRHIFAWAMREDVDAESGLSHLDHAACNLLMLGHYSRNAEKYGKLDDRAQ